MVIISDDLFNSTNYINAQLVGQGVIALLSDAGSIYRFIMNANAAIVD
jgi:hypothetical protein